MTEVYCLKYEGGSEYHEFVLKEDYDKLMSDLTAAKAQIETLKQARREDEATLTALQNARVQEARSALGQIVAVLAMLKEWNRSAKGDGIDGRELKRLVLKTEKVLDAAMRDGGKL